jgi:hypothetical protein
MCLGLGLGLGLGALTIGIFPYILKLLLAPPGDLRLVLIFI